MKILTNTLKPVIERWDDPGGPEPNGAGPARPSYDYIESIDGQIVVELAPEDCEGFSSHALYADVVDWLSDNPSEIAHEVGGLWVKKWSLDKLEGNVATLSVEEFACEVPEPPEREYDWAYEQDRKELREARDIEDMKAGL